MRIALLMIMKNRNLTVLGKALFLIGGLAWGNRVADAEPGTGGDAGLPNPFFAYCVGIGTGKENSTLEAQLQLPAMLSDLGYDGMAYVGLEGAEEMLEALEKKGQKLIAVYTPLVVDPEVPGYDPALKKLIPKLKGHGATVWLVVNSKQYASSSTDGDERAVALLREIADLAAQSGIRVSLYPHRGCYTERIEDVVRLVKKADRPNIGVTFTFCHFQAVEGLENLDRALELAKPWLDMVTINGTSGYDPGKREAWIQVLGEGSYDMTKVLKALRGIDYRGPVGIIAYGIRGDRRELLDRSMKGWKELSAKK